MLKRPSCNIMPATTEEKTAEWGGGEGPCSRVAHGGYGNTLYAEGTAFVSVDNLCIRRGLLLSKMIILLPICKYLIPTYFIRYEIVYTLCMMHE